MSPRIVKAAYGDTVALTIEAPNEANIEWIWRKQTLCEGAICELRTAGFGLGTFRIEARVEMGEDSYLVEFLLAVRADTDQVPQKVTPELVSRTIRPLLPKAGQWVTKSLTGMGFLYSEVATSQVGEVPEPLTETVKLKSQPLSIIEVTDSAVAARLAPRATVQWLPSPATLVHLDGTVLVQNFSDDPIRFFVGDVPLRLGAKGVVIVWRVLEGPSIYFEVQQLQGESLLFAGAENEIFLPAAAFFSSKTLEKSDREAFSTPDPATVKKAFAELLHEGDEAEEGEFFGLSKVLEEQRFFDAYLMLHDADPQELDANQIASLLRLCIQFFLLDEARDIAAASKFAKNWQVQYLTGLASLLQRKPREALAKWNGLRPPMRTQEVDYYLGVAEYQLGREYRAEKAFRYSLWRPGREEHSASALTYLERLEDSARFSLELAAKSFFDSNVAHTSVADNEQRGNIYSDAGVAVGVAATSWFSRDKNGGIILPLELEAVTYRQPRLTSATSVTAQSGVLFQFRSLQGEGPEEKLLVEAGPVLDVMVRGSETALAMVSVAARLEVPPLHGASIGGGWGYGKDARAGQVKSFLPLPDERASILIDDVTMQRARLFVAAAPQINADHLVPVELGMAMIQLAKPSAKAFDHQEFKFSATVESRWTPRLWSSANLLLSYRAFDRWPDRKRNDQGFSIGGKLNYFLWSHCQNYLELGYGNQNSTSSVHRYSAYQIAYGIAFEY